MNEAIEHNIDALDVISLDEINKIDLPRRIDTKFVFHKNHLAEILKSIQHDYQIQVIEGKRKQNYSTYYYDTPTKSFYFHHHQGKGNRFKIRVRHYHVSKDIFFEMKKKNNRNVTRKKRIRIHEQFEPGKLPEYLKNVGLDENMHLELSLANAFTRITLASRKRDERVTIDFDLSFTRNEKEVSLPYLVICEIKTNRKYSKSVLYKLLKQKHFKPTRISKYVVGNILFDKKLKKNRFKEKMRILKKIENEYAIT